MTDPLPQIRHVVVLMLENRSFDQMLGAMPGVDGASPAHVNGDGTLDYPQTPIANVGDPDVRDVSPDPKHETKPHVLRQLAGSNAGFVADYAESYRTTTPAQRQKIMSYYPNGSLHALHTLATTFAVADRWHCSVPGPTWTNRLFAMSGTSLGRVEMPTGPFDRALNLAYDQPSVFRRLFEAGRASRVYYGDVPLALLLSDQRVGVAHIEYDAAPHYYPMRHFTRHAARPEARFPDFVFIEPDYLWPTTNDDHPPHDPWNGQQLIATVYNAIRANDALWRSTLLVIVYDEHGGFYDHVVPPAAVAPDAHDSEYTFDRLGVRVPAVLVSPWLQRQVVSETFDHTSLLASLTAKWKLQAMGERTRQAADVFACLKVAAAPRDDTPARLVVDDRRAEAGREPAPQPTDHENAIFALSERLGERAGGPRRRIRRAAPPAERFQEARDRVRAFLDSRGAPR